MHNSHSSDKSTTKIIKKKGGCRRESCLLKTKVGQEGENTLGRGSASSVLCDWEEHGGCGRAGPDTGSFPADTRGSGVPCSEINSDRIKPVYFLLTCLLEQKCLGSWKTLRNQDLPPASALGQALARKDHALPPGLPSPSKYDPSCGNEGKCYLIFWKQFVV